LSLGHASGGFPDEPQKRYVVRCQVKGLELGGLGRHYVANAGEVVQERRGTLRALQ
jgi:hypothetical protein